MFVGEQPGDAEDRAGQPFVGPAGGLLDDALAEAGIDRSTVYLTNVVKHFTTTVEADPAAERTPPSVTLCNIDGIGQDKRLRPAGKARFRVARRRGRCPNPLHVAIISGDEVQQVGVLGTSGRPFHLPFAPAAPPQLSPHHWRTWV